MKREKIDDMKGSVIGLPRGRESDYLRDQRPAGPDASRRGVRMGTCGRAWINGREVGGTDPRFRHLTAIYD
jgi:hypothetical protein